MLRRRCGTSGLVLPLSLALGVAAATLGFAPRSPSSAPPAEPGGVADRESYAEVVKRIVDAVLADNQSYVKLQELCDGIGPRLSGSENLSRAIVWAQETMRRDGLENVRAEKVMVPKWVRGHESAEMTEPRRMPLAMLGLGGSVGTPPEGITAQVVAVRDKDELERVGDSVAGKIVLFNNPMQPYSTERGTGYGEAVRYRSSGAQWAAKYGAVAALTRSVTARSLRTPHTGATGYGDIERKIPFAAVSVEDAELIARLCARGVRVVITLKMEAHDEPDVESANTVGEIRGRELPDEVVVISGHFDSWDVGQGAHDDGGGCIMALEAAAALKRLDLRPRRTIRVVLWTNEENGLRGGSQYPVQHFDAMPQHVAAIEADSGTFEPRGYRFEINDAAREKRAVPQLAELMRVIAATDAFRGVTLQAQAGGSAADISRMKPFGVVLLGQEVDSSTYFDYHHTHADTVDKIDPRHLSQNVALMAATAFVLADMPGRLGDE
ncbi:MAG: hypothetical protein CHACPFDD_00126 [Phycisphaerae bacterium]|nr:hypothetical protein [Phycisphaerae bacterium]